MKFWLGLVFFSVTANTMEPIKLTVWKKVETVFGQEFVAANESVVDHIATLNRPTGIARSIAYNCQGKVRLSVVSVRSASPDPIGGWADVYTVYDLKDCAEIP